MKYEGKNVWYAVMRDKEDDDWGIGSNDYAEAVEMMNDRFPVEEYPDRYIAVIDADDSFCLDEIRDF